MIFSMWNLKTNFCYLMVCLQHPRFLPGVPKQANVPIFYSLKKLLTTLITVVEIKEGKSNEKKHILCLQQYSKGISCHLLSLAETQRQAGSEKTSVKTREEFRKDLISGPGLGKKHT